MDNAPIITPDPETTASGLSPQELDEVRARRASVRRAAGQLREILDAAGAPGEPGDGEPGDAVRAGSALAATENLDRVWRNHALVTESPDGVLEQIVTDCPRLAPAVDRARHEHEVVAATLRAVRARLAGLPPGSPIDPTIDRPALQRLLTAVDRHRRNGRDLLYQAYQVDLGLGE